MFILLVALIIILGLHCAYSNKNNIKHSDVSESNNEIQLEKFSSSLEQQSFDEPTYNTFQPVHQNIQGYDPESSCLNGQDYTADIPECNKTHLPIHGCAIRDNSHINATKLQKDPIFEGFTSSTESQQKAGASSIYNRGYNPIPTKKETPEKPDCPIKPPKPPNCPSSCIPEKYERCYNCDITTNKDINKYVLKSSVPNCPDLNDYAKKSNLCPCTDMSKYILKSEVPPCNQPDINDYVKKSEIPACPKCPTCPECPTCDNVNYDDIHNHPEYHKYISRKECERECEKHIKDEITEFSESDPKFRKAIKKYLREHGYIKSSKCPIAPECPECEDCSKTNNGNNGNNGMCGYSATGCYNNLYQNC